MAFAILRWWNSKILYGLPEEVKAKVFYNLLSLLPSTEIIYLKTAAHAQRPKNLKQLEIFKRKNVEEYFKQKLEDLGGSKNYNELC